MNFNPSTISMQKAIDLQLQDRKSSIKKQLIEKRMCLRFRNLLISDDLDTELSSKNAIVIACISGEFSTIHSLIANDSLINDFLSLINQHPKIVENLVNSPYLDYCFNFLEHMRMTEISKYENSSMVEWFFICLNFVLNVIPFCCDDSHLDVIRKIVYSCTEILLSQTSYRTAYLVLQILANFGNSLFVLEYKKEFGDFKTNIFERVHSFFDQKLNELEVPFDSLCYFYRTMLGIVKMDRIYQKV